MFRNPAPYLLPLSIIFFYIFLNNKDIVIYFYDTLLQKKKEISTVLKKKPSDPNLKSFWLNLEPLGKELDNAGSEAATDLDLIQRIWHQLCPSVQFSTVLILIRVIGQLGPAHPGLDCQTIAKRM